jgi:hypothetical protein
MVPVTVSVVQAFPSSQLKTEVTLLKGILTPETETSDPEPTL